MAAIWQCTFYKQTFFIMFIVFNLAFCYLKKGRGHKWNYLLPTESDKETNYLWFGKKMTRLLPRIGGTEAKFLTKRIGRVRLGKPVHEISKEYSIKLDILSNMTITPHQYLNLNIRIFNISFHLQMNKQTRATQSVAAQASQYLPMILTSKIY